MTATNPAADSYARSNTASARVSHQQGAVRTGFADRGCTSQKLEAVRLGPDETAAGPVVEQIRLSVGDDQLNMRGHAALSRRTRPDSEVLRRINLSLYDETRDDHLSLVRRSTYARVIRRALRVEGPPRLPLGGHPPHQRRPRAQSGSRTHKGPLTPSAGRSQAAAVGGTSPSNAASVPEFARAPLRRESRVGSTSPEVYRLSADPDAPSGLR